MPAENPAELTKSAIKEIVFLVEAPRMAVASSHVQRELLHVELNVQNR